VTNQASDRYVIGLFIEAPRREMSERKNIYGQPLPPGPPILEKREFYQWAEGVTKVARLLGARTVPVYWVKSGPVNIGELPWSTQVNVWDDRESPTTWRDAAERLLFWISEFELAGYDISNVSITPGDHFVVIG
jgi:hypothetical protein